MPNLDGDSIFTLKGEAHRLVEDSRSSDTPIRLGQALERVAKARGFANWNACSSHFAGKAVRRVPGHLDDFEELEDPIFMFSADQVGGGFSRAVNDLVMWARRLELLADSTDPSAYDGMLFVMGDRKPYMFELNTVRWPDRNYHLVDRGYTDWKHVAFTESELVELGFGEWARSKYCWSGVDAGFFVIDDMFGRNTDALGLKWLARLLIGVAKKVYAAQETADTHP